MVAAVVTVSIGVVVSLRGVFFVVAAVVTVSLSVVKALAEYYVCDASDGVGAHRLIVRQAADIHVAYPAAHHTVYHILLYAVGKQTAQTGVPAGVHIKRQKIIVARSHEIKRHAAHLQMLAQILLKVVDAGAPPYVQLGRVAATGPDGIKGHVGLLRGVNGKAFNYAIYGGSAYYYLVSHLSRGCFIDHDTKIPDLRIAVVIKPTICIYCSVAALSSSLILAVVDASSLPPVRLFLSSETLRSVLFTAL